jgi:hypothetical protein
MHLFVLPGSPVAATVLFALVAFVVFAHRDQITALITMSSFVVR